MSLHPSYSELNVIRTLQEYWEANKPAQLHTIYAEPQVDVARIDEWCRFQFLGFGNWIPESPTRFNIIVYTRHPVDTYKTRLYQLSDLTRDVWDIPGGLPLKDFTDPYSPTYVAWPPETDPANSADDAVKLNIRWDAPYDFAGPGNHGEVIQGRVIPYSVFHWKGLRSIW